MTENAEKWLLTYVDEHGRELTSTHNSKEAALLQGISLEHQKCAVKSLRGPNEFIEMQPLRLLMRSDDL